MAAHAQHPAPTAPNGLMWHPIAVAYYCEHPAGYRSYIAPAESGGFVAYVELPGLLRRYAPSHLSSMAEAQAWCIDGQRLVELREMA